MHPLTTGRRRRRGFTLLELLAIVVVLGILASIAIAKYGSTKRRVAISVMKGDLHNLTVLAESYYASNGTYEGFVPASGSAGVKLEFTGTGSGWTATATHPEAADLVCTAGNAEGVTAVPECK